MALLNRNLWRGEAYAGLYVLKDLDGLETQMKYFNNHDIKVNDRQMQFIGCFPLYRPQRWSIFQGDGIVNVFF